MCRSSRSAGTASLAQLGGPGASMRPTSKSEAAGRIFTALATKRETPSISCFAPSGTPPPRRWTDLPFDLRPYVRIVLLQQAHKNAMRRRPVGARMRKLPADHRVAKNIAVDERMGERNVHAAADIAPM